MKHERYEVIVAFDGGVTKKFGTEKTHWHEEFTTFIDKGDFVNAKIERVRVHCGKDLFWESDEIEDLVRHLWQNKR